MNVIVDSRTLFTALLVAGLLTVTNRGARAEETAYGYVGGYGGRTMAYGRDEEPPDDAPPVIYHRGRLWPYRYVFQVPNGGYTVRLHFVRAFDGGERANQARATVRVQGKLFLEDLVIHELNSGYEGRLGPLVKGTNTQVSDGRLEIDFPHGRNKHQVICAIELLDADGRAVLRLNCGSSEPVRDAEGRTWAADREWPEPAGVRIRLDEREERGEWQNISDEIITKLVQCNLGPRPRWYINGRDGMGVVGVFCDRAGHTYVNVLGRGLWHYGGPGGILERVDDGRYSGMINCRKPNNGNPRGGGVFFQMVLNPNGAGFCPISWSCFERETAQICSPDGEGLFNFWQPRDSWDYGTCDWNADVPRLFLISHHHHVGETWLSTDGGQSFEQIFDDGRRLHLLGIIGPNILLKALGPGEDGGKKPGVYRSTDLGETWQKVSDMKVTEGRGAVIYHKANDRAYMNTPDGLAVSDDRGETWQLIPDSPFFLLPVQFGREDDHLVGGNREGFYESRDGGRTWEKALDVPEGTHVFFWDPTRDVFYAGVYNGRWYRCQR